MAATDGLADLDDRRNSRRRRQPPTPRHPRPAEPASDDKEGSPAPASPTALVEDDQPGAAPPHPESSPPASNAVAHPQVAPAVATPLRAAQFYVDGESDEYLRKVRAEALARRLDVTASAVVRLALHRLMSELTPQQVADQLTEPPAWQEGVGRRRR